MKKRVHLNKHDHIAIVTIDNPPMNVLSKQVTSELRQVFSEIKEDRESVAVILTGSGERAFMAGADIKEFPTMMNMTHEELKQNLMEGSHHVFELIESVPKPTIAVLNGYTLGGGCELALTCDLRIAEEHVQIGLPEIKLGLFPGAGGTQRLPRIIGKSRAKELMFLGDPISAEEALRIGLVNKVVPKGEGMQAAQAIAEKLAGHSLQALSRIKQAVNEGLERSFHSAIELEADLFTEVFHTEDAKEGVQAFIEKRPAKFKHR